MTSSSRIVLLIVFLGTALLAKREFGKPSLADQQEELGKAMRREGSLDEFSSPTLADINAKGLPVQNLSLLFTLIIAASLTGGLCLFKIVLPLFKDGLDEAFVDTSNQTGYVKAKVLVSEEKYPEAIAMLKKYIAQTPEDKRGVLEISRIQAELLGDAEAATRTLEAAAEDRATDSAHAAEYLYKIVELYKQGNNPAKAREWAEVVMHRHPSSPQAGQAASLAQQLKEAEWLAKQQGS
jgi:tetratricopeptide (TPR) repeat protein